MDARTDSWPPLPLAAWADTYATLHMWTQVVGKIRLALAAPINHWWHVTFMLSARGLTTLPMPCGNGTIEIAFDFTDHQLIVERSDGRRRTIALEPKSVATFYREVMTTLAELDVHARIWPMPVEIPSPIRFDQDEQHHAYDRLWAERCWRVLRDVDVVFKEFRGRFLGKSSPSHFFWGSFDLAVTRFSGRRAPERPDADAMTREGYSHEVISAGFWPGREGVADAVFYAYAAPEPEGFRTAPVRPERARYDSQMNEFLLSYDAVRTASSPRDVLLDFLQSTYEAGAALAKWNRSELERR
jgi:hypothetical protein